jgi:hypothetical protein
MTLPFHSVTSPTDQQTHLVLHTPAMPGHRPDQLPHVTPCLHATVSFMALPTFGVRQ